jgi:hypothetical protein
MKKNYHAELLGIVNCFINDAEKKEKMFVSLMKHNPKAVIDAYLDDSKNEVKDLNEDKNEKEILFKACKNAFIEIVNVSALNYTNEYNIGNKDFQEILNCFFDVTSSIQTIKSIRTFLKCDLRVARDIHDAFHSTLALNNYMTFINK